MIVLLDPHSLDPALAHHLMSREKNTHVAIRSHGLLTSSAIDAFRELKLLATGSRTARPGCHAILSPSREYSEAEWNAAWSVFEGEFGLEDQPYLEAIHEKYGRGGRAAAHRHRVYLRVRADGKCIHLPHIAPRAELVARQCEMANGEVLTRGRWNRAVMSRLEAAGKRREATALRVAGFWDSQRPEATSRAERAVTERNEDISADEAKRAAYVAWIQSDDGKSLIHRLRSAGLHACIGDSGRPVILTQRGTVYRLAAAIASGAKACGADPVKGSAVANRLFGLFLPSVEHVRQDLETAPPLYGWRSVTGAERSAPKLTADEGRRNLKTRESTLAMNRRPDWHDNTAGRGRFERKRETPTAEETIKARQFFERAFGFSSQGKLPFKAGVHPKSMSGFDTRPLFDEEVLAPLSPADVNFLTLKGVSKASSFKAALAGVDAEHGDVIRWVEKKPRAIVIDMKEQDQKIIIRPETVSARSPSESTLAVMVSYVAKCGQSTITIRGGGGQICETAARLLTRKGIHVANPELRPVIEDELTVIRLRHLAEQWKTARKSLADGSVNLVDYAKALEEIEPYLDEIERRWPPAASMLREEIAALNRNRVSSVEFENDQSGHVRPPFS